MSRREYMTFSAYQFKDKGDIPFNPQHYSKFKFGSKCYARIFGKYLAEEFVKHREFNLVKLAAKKDNKEFVVLSSPYKFIPTATFALKDYFIQGLNEELIKADCKPVSDAKMYRTISYKHDYGSMNWEQRHHLIGKDKFHMDKDFLEGKICIFLDDIKITGAHEKVVRDTIVRLDLDIYFMFVYLAELKSHETDPAIENYLNFAAVKDLTDLHHIINNREEGFLLNTRTVKYILNYDHDGFKEFVRYQDKKFLRNLYHQAIGNEYHLEPDYKTNLDYLKQFK